MKSTTSTPLVFALGAFVVAAVLAVSVVGCDSANPVAPTGTMLSVSASPTKIGLNGTSEITVIGRRPDGSALFPGTEIGLATSLGSIDPLVEVGQGGVARATLRADGRSGTATVTASTTGISSGGGGGGGGDGGGGGGGTVANSTTVQIGETEMTRPSIVISANPDTIPVGDGEATITVIGRNFDGTTVGAGLPVTLTTTLGEIEPNRPVTDSSGTATATLRAGGIAGIATVSAFIGASEQMSVEVTIQDFVGGISLQPSPSQVSRSQNQSIAVTLEAIVENPAGQPARGVFITFTSEFGTIQGDRRVQTDESGVAVVNLSLNPSTLPAGVTEFAVTASGSGPNGRVTDDATITVVP